MSDFKGHFVRAGIFQLFLRAGTEREGGEAKPTQKTTLFPDGSPATSHMNGVLKNITLGTRLFFILHYESFRLQGFQRFVSVVHKYGRPVAGLPPR